MGSILPTRKIRRILLLAIPISLPAILLAIIFVPCWATNAAAPENINLPEFVPTSKIPLLSATQTYSITDLGTLGGTQSEAFAISQNGQIAGVSKDNGDVNTLAFRYKNGIMQSLGSLGSDYSSGYGINNLGEVVGESINADNNDRAFLYTNTMMTDLGTFGGNYSVAWGINNHGEVVGEAELPGNLKVHAFVYTHTAMTDLGVLGTGSTSRAFAINDKGQVVGVSEYDSSKNTHAFLYSNGTMHDLGSLGGNNAANAINDNSQVVGWSYLSSGKYVAFISNGRTMQQIGGTLGGNTTANGINDKGQVVGDSGIGFSTHAILIDNGQMFDLNDLIPSNSGWVLTDAYAINNQGKIAGVGSYKGQIHGFLLTPHVPWTVMVYMSSDSNLDTFLSNVFNQLELAANNPYVHIIVLWDPSGQNDSAYYQVKYDTNLKSLANYTTNVDYFPQGELNMGDPNTLVNFVNWAETNYPASYYGLILVDHGSGLNGSMLDDQNPNDLLTVKEMGTALDTITAAGTKKIDILQEYACLMGMVEDAYQVRNYANYYISSESDMWGDASPFNATISRIISGTTPLQLANQAASNYSNVEKNNNNAFTISVADLSQINTLTPTINTLAHVLNSDMVTAAITLTNIISPSVQRYDQNNDTKVNVKDTYIDLYDFARLVKLNYSDPVIQAAAQGVMDSINSYVVYENHGNGQGPGTTVWNLSNSHGVSIFFPSRKSSFYNGYNLDFANGTAWFKATQSPSVGYPLTPDWGNMLSSYIHTVNPTGPDDPNPPNPVPLLVPPNKLFAPLVFR